MSVRQHPPLPVRSTNSTQSSIGVQWVEIITGPRYGKRNCTTCEQEFERTYRLQAKCDDCQKINRYHCRKCRTLYERVEWDGCQYCSGCLEKILADVRAGKLPDGVSWNELLDHLGESEYKGMFLAAGQKLFGAGEAFNRPRGGEHDENDFENRQDEATAKQTKAENDFTKFAYGEEQKHRLSPTQHDSFLDLMNFQNSTGSDVWNPDDYEEEFVNLSRYVSQLGLNQWEFLFWFRYDKNAEIGSLLGLHHQVITRWQRRMTTGALQRIEEALDISLKDADPKNPYFKARIIGCRERVKAGVLRLAQTARPAPISGGKIGQKKTRRPAPKPAPRS